MDTPAVLWIELSSGRRDKSLLSRLSDVCRIQSVDKLDEIYECIDRMRPQLLCFNYDYPDLMGLAALRDAKRRYPSVPILMLTRPNSEGLAVWALRARVWDYLTKPVEFDELHERIILLSKITQQSEGSRRQLTLPEQSIPIHVRGGGYVARQVTAAAINYVRNHYHEKVSLRVAAQSCGMEATSFSRAFKREHRITFREYLMRYRFKKAAVLLGESSTTVLDVAFAVGFNDPSQFTRMFKRYMGLTPSQFRSQSREAQGLPFDAVLPLPTSCDAAPE